MRRGCVVGEDELQMHGEQHHRLVSLETRQRSSGREEACYGRRDQGRRKLHVHGIVIPQ